MAMQPVRQYMTFEQYLLLVNNSDRRYEYFDGDVRLLAGGTSNHAAIALNCGIALDQALGENVACRPYVSDKLVRVTPTKVVIPDVVVSCDTADHGEAQIIDSPMLVVEVLSLASLDRGIEVEVRQLYRRLSIPAMIETVEGENSAEQGEQEPGNAE